MSKIVHLNQFKKAKKRLETDINAQNNRVKHGRTKAEKKLAEAKLKAQNRLLDDKEIID